MVKTDYKEFDWYSPVMKPEKMSLKELEHLNKTLLLKFILNRPLDNIKALFSKSRHRRRVYGWSVYVLLKNIVIQVKDLFRGKINLGDFTGMLKLRKPDWYDD